MKTEEQINSMIADIEVYAYEADIELEPYMKGYVMALKWSLGELDKK